MPFFRYVHLRRIAPYVLVCAIGIFLFYTAAQFDFVRRTGTLGPDAWPKIILGLLITVCLCEITRIVLAKNPDDLRDDNVLQDITRDVDTAPDVQLPAAPENHPWLLLAGMAATLGYVALVPTTGFFLTTAVYLAAFLVIGGYRRRKVIFALSFGGALVLMFVFMKLVYVSLPLGSGPFAQLTILLMKLMGIR